MHYYFVYKDYIIQSMFGELVNTNAAFEPYKKKIVFLKRFSDL